MWKEAWKRVLVVHDCEAEIAFNRNLTRFVKFLKEEGYRYENLREFQDDGRKIHQQMVISLCLDSTTNIIDGAHRAVILALRGATCIKTYLAYKRSV